MVLGDFRSKISAILQLHSSNNSFFNPPPTPIREGKAGWLHGSMSKISVIPLLPPFKIYSFSSLLDGAMVLVLRSAIPLLYPSRNSFFFSQLPSPLHVRKRSKISIIVPPSSSPLTTLLSTHVRNRSKIN